MQRFPKQEIIVFSKKKTLERKLQEKKELKATLCLLTLMVTGCRPRIQVRNQLGLDREEYWQPIDSAVHKVKDVHQHL